MIVLSLIFILSVLNKFIGSTFVGRKISKNLREHNLEKKKSI